MFPSSISLSLKGHHHQQSDTELVPLSTTVLRVYAHHPSASVLYDDALAVVFSFLSTSSLSSVRQTCQTWERVSRKTINRSSIANLYAINTGHTQEIHSRLSSFQCWSAWRVPPSSLIAQHTHSLLVPCDPYHCHLLPSVTRSLPSLSALTLVETLYDSSWLSSCQRVVRGYPAVTRMEQTLLQLISLSRSPSSRLPLNHLSLYDEYGHQNISANTLHQLFAAYPQLHSFHFSCSQAAVWRSTNTTTSTLFQRIPDRYFSFALFEVLQKQPLTSLTTPCWMDDATFQCIIDREAIHNGWVYRFSLDRDFPLSVCAESLLDLTIQSRGVHWLPRGELLFHMISRLSQLQRLSLPNCLFENGAETSATHCIQQLNNLTELHLSGTFTQSHSWMQALSTRQKLQHLHFSTDWDAFEWDLPLLLNSCPQLLSLGCIPLTGDSSVALSSFPLLSTLIVNCRHEVYRFQNQSSTWWPRAISDIQLLPSITTLTTLTLQRCPSDYLFVVFTSKLSQLKSLSIQIDYLHAWQKAPKAKDIHINCSLNAVTNTVSRIIQRESLSSTTDSVLPALTHLHLCSPRFHAAVMTHILSLTSLRSLHLHIIDVLDSDYWADIATADRMAPLAEEASFQDVDLLLLSHLPDLRQVHLQGIKELTVRCLPALAHCPVLQRVVLEECRGIHVSEIDKIQIPVQIHMHNKDQEQIQYQEAPLLASFNSVPHPAVTSSSSSSSSLFSFSLPVSPSYASVPSAVSSSSSSLCILDSLQLIDCPSLPSLCAARVRREMTEWSRCIQRREKAAARNTSPALTDAQLRRNPFCTTLITPMCTFRQEYTCQPSRLTHTYTISQQSTATPSNQHSTKESTDRRAEQGDPPPLYTEAQASADAVSYSQSVHRFCSSLCPVYRSVFQLLCSVLYVLFVLSVSHFLLFVFPFMRVRVPFKRKMSYAVIRYLCINSLLPFCLSFIIGCIFTPWDWILRQSYELDLAYVPLFLYLHYTQWELYEGRYLHMYNELLSSHPLLGRCKFAIARCYNFCIRLLGFVEGANFAALFAANAAVPSPPL